MAETPEPNLRTLLVQARRALGFTQAEMGDALGLSMRTVQRWEGQLADPTRTHFGQLAALIHPVRADLAEAFAARAGSSLVGLGLVKPADAGPKVNPLVPFLVEAVVAAAAEALDCPPRQVRPALLAAFRCAAQSGVTLAEVVAGLEPHPAGANPAPAPAAAAPGSDPAAR